MSITLQITENDVALDLSFNVTNISSLNDVDLTGLTLNQFLKWNGSKWIGAAISGGGDMLAANNLSDLISSTTALTNLGFTASITELNYTNGVTSPIQTQIDAISSGEANTASNVGTAGVGIFKQKTGVNFELKKINAGSTKITITDDIANNEVDIDLGSVASTDLSNTSNITLNTATQTLTNKSGDISQWTNDSGYITATLTQEQVEDFAGNLISNVTGTHTGITITYQDITGDIDFVVDNAAALGNLSGINSGDQTITLTGDITGSGTGSFAASVDSTAITGQTEKVSPVSGDFLLAYDTAGAGLKKVDIGNLPSGGGGEINTASNGGIGGVGITLTKSGSDLPFKSINAGSTKITITDDVPNSNVDIDVDETVLNIANMSGSITLAEVSDSGTLAGLNAVAALNDISNVTITANSGGEVLKWSGTAWINNTLAEAGISATSHNHTLTDVTDSGALAALNTVSATEIDNNAVSLAKLADMATASFVGRNTAATGDPEILSATTARAILNVENGATADQTGAEIKAAYEVQANAYTDTKNTKLSGIATGATANPNALDNIVEDLTPQLGASLDLNSKGITEELTAAVALVAGDLCYMNSVGKLDKANATTSVTADTMIALCLDTIALNAVGTFLLYGKFTTTGLTAGENHYISTTAGGITATAPSATGNIVRVIGTALSTTVLFFNPDITFIEIA